MTVSLSHHDLCFGCGQANLFGLHLELEQVEHGALTGRFFIKQDHQGPDGTAHPGIIGAALEEAIAHLLESTDVRGGPIALARLQIDYRGRAPVGTYVQLRAWLEHDSGARATAYVQTRDGDGATPVAEAHASLSPDRSLTGAPVGE